MNRLKEWTKREIRILEPIERLSMREWMPKYRIMPKESVKPGNWDSSLTPYLDGLMDLLTLHTTEEFILKKSAQIAGSELGYSYIMWANDQCPGDSLIVLADQDTAEWTCKDRFEKGYKASPKLRKLFKSATMNTVKAQGQTNYFSWATSINKLASKPIKILHLDETSKYKVNKIETKPVYNAIERTEAYVDSKIIMTSTPNVPGSEIDIYYKTAHVRYLYYIPCPHCNHYQILRWTRQKYLDLEGNEKMTGYVVWEGGRNATPVQVSEAGYVCGECGVIISTKEKNEAVSKGIWHTNDEYQGTPTKIAAHINRLYSLFPGGKFQSIVEEFIRKKKDGTVDAMKGFVNNVLAEEFQEVVEVPQKVNIVSRVSKSLNELTVPSDSIAVTCGVDNQKDHKYYAVVAFNKEFKGSLIEYGKLLNWHEVESLADRKYSLSDDKVCKTWRIAVDSGGTFIDGKSMTHEVYNFVRHKDRFFAIKGKDMDNSVIIQRKVLEENIVLYRVNTQALLDQFYWMLSKDEFTFHAQTDKELMNHVLNFHKIKDDSGRFKWEQKGGRVDYVHCIIYAIAAAHPQWENGIAELRRLPFLQSTNGVKKKKVQQNRNHRTINPAFQR